MKSDISNSSTEKNMPDALSRTWNENQWMFEEGADCAKLHDRDGRILTISRNGQCSLEIDNIADFEGVPWPEIWPEEMRPTIDSVLRTAREGKITRFTAFCPTAKGTPKWWSVLVTPVFDSQGNVEKILSVGSDVTELERTKEELREKVAQKEFLLGAGQIGEWDFNLVTGTIQHSLRHDQCFGYTEKVVEWNADIFLQHVHPKDLPRITEQLQDVQTKLEAFQFECRVIWPDKSVHWILVQGAPYRCQGKQPSRLLGMVADITERKRAETLAEGQKKALELAVTGAALSDILDVLTRTAEDATGNTIMTSLLLVSPDGQHLQHGSAPSLPASYSQALDGAEIGPFIGPCTTAAHHRKQIIVRDIATDATWENFRSLALSYGLRSCWSQPILSSQGKLLGTLAAYRDRVWQPMAGEREALGLLLNTVSLVLDRHRETMERIAAEEGLRQLAAELAEANQRKTEFLATLAHELRNPLAPISSGLEVIGLAGHDRAVVSRTRDIMMRQVVHMTHLINDLLDIARITSGKLELKKEQVDLKAVLTTAVDTSMPLIEAAKHELKVSIPDDPIALEADPTRIAQVVSNLLNNAAKYTPASGRITLTVTRKDKHALISVADTGVGLEPKALSSVFEMFSQVRQNVAHSQGGLGIGLTLVRRLVELHDGAISASSAGAGKGSTFTVRLPVIEQENSLEDAGSPLVTTVSRVENGLRILVVDDNEDAAAMLSSLLEINGHSVRTAHTGGSAICLAEEFMPDLIFLDIGLPDMDGYALARTLRQGEGTNAAILIALTGWGAQADRLRSKEAGFNHHLTKPANFSEISRILSDLTTRTPEKI